MEEEILKKFEEQNRKLDRIYDSTEKARKYFLWSLVFNVVIFILPLVGLIFIIPWFLKIYDPASYGL